MSSPDRPKKHISRYLAGIVLGLALLGAAWLTQKSPQDEPSSKPLPLAESPEISKHPEIRDFARDFSSFESFDPVEVVPDEARIISGQGKDVFIRQFAGKVVVLNFWATWCAPCVKELPSLAKLKKQRPDIEVITVSMDMKIIPDELRKFLDKHQAEQLDVYYDQGVELQKTFEVQSLPATYILSPNSQILYKMIGSTDWSSDVTLEFLNFVKQQG